MPKKHRKLVLYGQIILIWLAVVMFFAYFMVRIISPAFANLSAIVIGLGFLAMAMLLGTVAYEKSPLRQKNFSEEKSKNFPIANCADSTHFYKQNEPTPQAKRLHEALSKRDIHNELEFYDGHKHVDISIPWAKLNLEIDGKYHLTDPDHLFRDLERDSYSHLDGIDTIRIPNIFVESDLDEIANAIAEVAKKRRRC